MTPHSSWIRAVALRHCSPNTIERLIDPILADIECERREALSTGRRWQARWISARGYVGLCKAVMALAVQGGSSTPDEAPTRILGVTAAVFIAVTLVLVLPPLVGFYRHSHIYFALYLVPQALPLSIPIAVAFGIARGLFGNVTSSATLRRILLVGTVGCVCVFASMEWVVPAANQGFRVALAREIAPRELHGLRGINERSLSELAALLRKAAPPGTPEDAEVRREFREMAAAGPRATRESLRLHLHLRLSLCLATGVLSLLAVAIARGTRRRRAAGSAFTVVVILYVLALFKAFTMSPTSPAMLAWAPNGSVVALSLLLLCLKRSRGAPPVRSSAS